MNTQSIRCWLPWKASTHAASRRWCPAGWWSYPGSNTLGLPHTCEWAYGWLVISRNKEKPRHEHLLCLFKQLPMHDGNFPQCRQIRWVENKTMCRMGKYYIHLSFQDCKLSWWIQLVNFINMATMFVKQAHLFLITL